MNSGLDVARRVITAPNSAFAQIRDCNGELLAWSVGFFVIGSLVGSLFFAPTVPLSEDWVGETLFAGVNLLSGIVFAAAIFLIGRRLGGNKSWKTVFSAIFYTYVLVLPALAALVALTLAAGGISAWQLLTAAGDPGFFESAAGEEFLLSSMFGFLMLLVAGVLAFAVWVVVVSVKAVKTVNGFGTAKAFGIVMIGLLASVIVAMPFGP